MSRSREVSISDVSSADHGHGLNGMPKFGDIEQIAELREMAEEKLNQLGPNSDQAHKIRQALADLENTHHRADHLDADHQCGSRDVVRGRS